MASRPMTDTAALLASLRQGLRPEYLFFWGHKAARAGEVGKHCLSQWWPAAFTVDGATYPTAEHFMMAEKARLFGDADALARVLAAGSPAAAKRIGRQVRGFTEQRWSAARWGIVVRGSEAKFASHPALGAYLEETGERVLVEASPRDRVWGIGLGAGDPRAANPAQWRGLNLLGFALMEARRRLRSRRTE
jgi:ribA/ribD-fused uncharacterized protein